MRVRERVTSLEQDERRTGESRRAGFHVWPKNNSVAYLARPSNLYRLLSRGVRRITCRERELAHTDADQAGSTSERAGRLARTTRAVAPRKISRGVSRQRRSS